MPDAALKPGWHVWRFDQMAVSVNDRIDNPAEADVDHYVGLEHLDTDSLKIRRWGAPSDVEATKLRFRRGDIIFGRRRVYQRKLAVANFDGICSAHAMVLRPKTDVVLPEFLPFFMQSDLFMDRALEISVGSLSPTINWKTLASQEFALPPLEEQRRIVSVLNSTESLKQELVDLLQATSRLRDMLRARVVQRTLLGGSSVIGDIAHLAIDRQEVSSSDEYQIIGVYSFGRGLLDRGVRSGHDTRYRYLHRIRKEQIVLSKLKAWEGAVAIVEPEHDGAYVSPEYPTFDLDQERIKPAFMKLICESPMFWRNISSHSRGTADRRARIYPQDFLKVSICIPSLDDQEWFIDQVGSILESENLCRNRLETVSLVKKSLLRSCLYGEDGISHGVTEIQ